MGTRTISIPVSTAKHASAEKCAADGSGAAGNSLEAKLAKSASDGGALDSKDATFAPSSAVSPADTSVGSAWALSHNDGLGLAAAPAGPEACAEAGSQQA